MQFLKDIYSLFYPKICVCCKNLLIPNEDLICTICRHDLPVICYTDFKKNKITELFYGKIPIEMANSLLQFQKDGKTQELIHQLKYHGQQEIGTFLGNWWGTILHQKGIFEEIDIIIPIPLHKKRLRQRGYNQLTTFGESLGSQLNIPFNGSLLKRSSATATQTFKNKTERYSNVFYNFYVKKGKCTLENKHVLLIDDVITTGSTLEACCTELLKIEGINISLLTIAFTD